MRQPLYSKLLMLLLQQCRLSSTEPSPEQLVYRRECADLIISCYQLLGTDVLTALHNSACSSPVSSVEHPNTVPTLYVHDDKILSRPFQKVMILMMIMIMIMEKLEYNNHSEEAKDD